MLQASFPFADSFRVLLHHNSLRSSEAEGAELDVAEDLAQEVMLTVHLKASHNFAKAPNCFVHGSSKSHATLLTKHHRKQAMGVETVNLWRTSLIGLAASHMPAATPARESSGRWTAFLNLGEQEFMRLRFIEQWQYHEIAAAHAVPIGTVLGLVFNAQKKLAGYLKTRLDHDRQAAQKQR